MRGADTGESARETPTSAAAPGEFGHATTTVARVAATARRTVLIAALFYPAGLALYLNLLAPDGDSVAIDFVAFWAAAKLAVQGAATAAFDWPTLSAAQSLPSSAANAYFGWHYPPTFHLLVAPLGWLNFTLAFTVFTACAVAAYYFALRPWSGSAPVARDLAIASPAVCLVVFTGNTSLLWVAAFLAAMHCLSRDRPVRAGAFIALLTLKPQLGLLIPVALIAGRHWRAVLAATASTAVLAALATGVFGWHHWIVFFDKLGAMGSAVTTELTLTKTMVTWYGFIRQTGGSHDTAVVVQVFWTISAVAVVTILWRQRNGNADLRIAALLFATLVGVPRAYSYELLFAVVAAFFLARAGIGRNAAGRVWLMTLWLLPVPGRLIGGLELAQYATPVITISLALCAWIAIRRAHGTALPT